jgi:hypothetical protein
MQWWSRTATADTCVSDPESLAEFLAGADDADYADRGGITFGSTCTCGGVPEPYLPLLRGEASSTNRGVPALDCRVERLASPRCLTCSTQRPASR